LRIAVDHDRFVAGLAERERGMDAAIVELDALPDPIRTAPENHDLAAIGAVGLVAAGLVGRVEVRRVRDELRAARVDGLVDRADTHALAPRTHGGLPDAEDLAEPRVREARLLERAQSRPGERVERRAGEEPLLRHQLVDVAEEPRVDLRK